MSDGNPVWEALLEKDVKHSLKGRGFMGSIVREKTFTGSSVRDVKHYKRGTSFMGSIVKGKP